MYQTYVFAVFLLVATPACAQSPDHGGEGFLTSYRALALQGDLSMVERELSKTVRGREEQDYYDEFHARFIARTSGLDLDAADDKLLRATAHLYQDYWREALLEPSGLAASEGALYEGVADLLRIHDGWDSTSHDGDILAALKAALEKRGYFVLLGRTAPLLEFMIWRENETVSYGVELTDTLQPVTVNFLDGFISKGWLRFATMGKHGTGGWANADGLFAVNSYDRAAEKFLVSYLKHEGRHFADYGIFPSIGSADLEYRAKLTELAYADSELERLLTGFTSAALRTESSPHALANWYVISDLTAALSDREWPDGPAFWSGFSKDIVHQAAERLLEKHTRILKQQGAATTEGTIRP